ncbi:uncharacterized protein [Prorops nasuta]|uniref:uncharacterized protein isoform X2 n=1 Tax=Prorops nasuta TaxID=863751 RepID=UPI0034CEDB33
MDHSKKKICERKLWLFNGYRYHITKTKNGRRYLRCIKYAQLGCRAHGIYYNNEFRSSKEQHNHEPEREKNEKLSFYKNMLTIAKTRGTKPKDIYNAAIMNQPEIQNIISFPSSRRTIQRYVKQSQNIHNIKLKDKTLKELAESLIKNKEILQYTNNNKNYEISVKIIEKLNNYSLIFYDKNFINNMNGDILFVDGTFKCVPQLKDKNMQLITVLLKVDNDSDKALPCIWVLMNNKLQENYIEIFQFVKSTFPNLKPKVAMTDFEIGFRNALKTVFPHIITTHCFFHFAQTN